MDGQPRNYLKATLPSCPNEQLSQCPLPRKDSLSTAKASKIRVGFHCQGDGGNIAQSSITSGLQSHLRNEWWRIIIHWRKAAWKSQSEGKRRVKRKTWENSETSQVNELWNMKGYLLIHLKWTLIQFLNIKNMIFRVKISTKRINRQSWITN